MKKPEYIIFAVVCTLILAAPTIRTLDDVTEEGVMLLVCNPSSDETPTFNLYREDGTVLRYRPGINALKCNRLERLGKVEYQVTYDPDSRGISSLSTNGVVEVSSIRELWVLIPYMLAFLFWIHIQRVMSGKSKGIQSFKRRSDK